MQRLPSREKYHVQDMRGHISFWKFINVWYYWTLGYMEDVLKVRPESKAKNGYVFSHSTVLSLSHRDKKIMKGYKERGKIIRFVFQVQNLGISMVHAIQ